VANELPHVFGRNVTGSIDSFPINIYRPQGSNNMQRWFYNGKYACHVVKVQYHAINCLKPILSIMTTCIDNFFNYRAFRVFDHNLLSGSKSV